MESPDHSKGMVFETNGQTVKSKVGDLFGRRVFAQCLAGASQGVVDDALVLRLLGGGGDQRGVGCRIVGLDLLNSLDIPGVGHNDSDFAELFE